MGTDRTVRAVSAHELFQQIADGDGNKVLGGQGVAIVAPPAGGTGAAAGAYDTAENRDLMIAAVNNILAALRAHGLIAT